MPVQPKAKRDQRIEFRATAQEKALLAEAAVLSGTDLTTFALQNLTDAAKRVLADQTSFTLDPAAHKEWERINNAEPVELEGLKKLLGRPSPFKP